MKEQKSEIVGEFRVVLYDTGFGYQVRTLFSDGAVYDTQMSKPTLQLGVNSFESTCAVLKAQLRLA